MAAVNLKLPAPTATQLRALATSRLQEVSALRASGHYAAAWYLAGYVLELALKAVICRNLAVSAYPETALGGRLKTHDTEDLVLLAGLSADLTVALLDPEFNQNWLLVSSWDPQYRYQSERTGAQIDELFAAYSDPMNGVFTWLSKRWL